MATQKQIDNAQALLTEAENEYKQKANALSEINQQINALREASVSALMDLKVSEGKLKTRTSDLDKLKAE